MTDNTIADLQATVAEARSEFAHQNGDGFYQPDWLGASEYEDEGYRLGEAAMLFPDAQNRETFIEAAAEQHPASARYLIWKAARLRIAECERAASKEPAKPSFFSVACEIVGGGA